ncbi:hypothetical protein HYALB_00007678 [Hymenoscyphus albidus]|uniref:Uncharacterized protein n=1 Tax=Hymenoscyphus albidus TaxID=595503 RepID=A0A9N9LE85_9HELO|nr:hypothetical protein HYALB_00007678 [Hymenoscyphus albidus]
MAYPSQYLFRVRDLEGVLCKYRQKHDENMLCIESELKHRSDGPQARPIKSDTKKKKKRVRFASHDSSGKITTMSTTPAIDRKKELDSELLKLRELCLMLDCLERQIQTSKFEKKDEVLYYINIRFTRLVVLSEKHILELELLEKEARLSRVIRRMKEQKSALRHEVNSWLSLQERTSKPLRADSRKWGSRTEVSSEANLRAERFRQEFEVGACGRTLEKLQESLNIILLVEKAAAISGRAVTAAAFSAEHNFEKITVFERRECAGGTWIYDQSPPHDLPIRPGSLPPDSDPPLEIPNNLPKITSPNEQERFTKTPIYSSLT